MDADAIIDSHGQSLNAVVNAVEQDFNRDTIEQAAEFIRRALRAHPESLNSAFDAMIHDPVGRRILQDKALVARLYGVLESASTEVDPPRPHLQTCAFKPKWHIFSGVAIGLAVSLLIASIVKRS